MENFQKFIKKAVKIAVISSVGLMPGQLKGQDVNKGENEIRIENNESLKSQIFDEVGVAFENGILKNTPNNAYFFSLENGNYRICYDLDANNDNEKDSIPTIEVSYSDNNSNYYLNNSPHITNNKDIVYNYKDSSLLNSESKTYRDFFTSNTIVIRELHGKEDSPVHFRKINKEELGKFLNNIKQFSQRVDSAGINENNKNIKAKESEVKIKKQEKKESEEVVDISKNIFNFLKEKKTTELDKVSYGNYSYRIYGSNIDIFFVDSDGYTNEVSIGISKNEIKKARKFNNNGGNVNIKDLSGIEIKKIVDGALVEISNK